MKTILRILLCLAALAAPAGEVHSQSPPPLRESGNALLLHTEKVMEGEIVRRGDKYRIGRAIGELWLPAAQVKFVGASWDDVFAYMASQANLIDPDERLRLAKWCYDNGRPEHAVREARAALDLRPNHAPTEQFLRVLERTADIARRPPATAQPAPELPLPPSLDLSADSLGLFVAKVQPVLMNTCASCHANGQGGNFKLMRIFDAGPGSRRITQFNLAAVIGQVDLERPSLSPLLLKAVSSHGTALKEPIASRSAPAFKILQQWVDITLASNPHLKEMRALAAAKGGNAVRADYQTSAAPPTSTGTDGSPAKRESAFADGRTATPAAETALGAQPRLLPKFTDPVPAVTSPAQILDSAVQRAVVQTPATPAAPAAPRVLPAQPQPVPTPPQTSAPTAPPTDAASHAYSPRDPFDPAIFNLQVHGKQK